MDRAIYVAMTGARDAMYAQAVHANNLANVNTTGFRADYEQARAMPVFGEMLPSRVYAMTEKPGADFQQGSMNSTGRDLDVAVNGKGFIAVMGADGKEAYTRAGEFLLDEQGTLRTGEGFAVLGSGGPIQLPPYEKVDVGGDGSISLRARGSSSAELSTVDRIKLVNPDVRNLVKGTDGLFRSLSGEDETVSPAVRLVSGTLEGSNVNAVAELTSIISVSRQFEMGLKMMKHTEENDAAATKILQG